VSRKVPITKCRLRSETSIIRLIMPGRLPTTSWLDSQALPSFVRSRALLRRADLDARHGARHAESPELSASGTRADYELRGVEERFGGKLRRKDRGADEAIRSERRHERHDREHGAYR